MVIPLLAVENMVFKNRHPNAGARPGTLVLSHDARETLIRVTQLTGSGIESQVYDSVSEIPEQTDPNATIWIDVAGLGSGEMLASLADRYHISPLAMEDLVNETKRPKVELFEHQQLVVAHGMSTDKSGSFAQKHLGLVFDGNFVITFHQDCDDLLRPIRKRMENPNARLRRNGTDYLVYAIVDVLVDSYYPVLEQLGEKLERLEELALESPHPEVLAQVHTVKNQLLWLRRSVWPQRDMVQSLLFDDSPFVSDQTERFLRDTLDHCAQIADIVDMYRESATGLANTYMSAVAHRSNEVMKVMTLMTSLFVPPTFLAGVYGMNFAGMPELSSPFAYPLVLAIMIATIAGMVVFFRRRGWIGSSQVARLVATDGGSNQKPSSNAFVLGEDFSRTTKRTAA